ncbi:alkaline phosphatase family protein [Cryobacterium sp. Y62]|uniref:alkaline phosphatase family protein n=1 Tax=Cryobacterium sp. Y62 TaxID=2048284 RepID=UPI000CE2D4DF|nr:alkaline phosphatase family protein [Cryobacterium sp. Y62]
MSETSTQSPHRLLLVGIDGVRLDMLTRIPTPALDRVTASGFLATPLVDPRNITVSGPMWATVLSGLWSDEHGVVCNERPPDDGIHAPDFLSRILQRQPDSKLFAAVSWAPLASRAGCGPLINPETAECFVADCGSETVDDYIRADAAVEEYSVRRLADEPVRAAFVYFGEADEACHEFGMGDEYETAIRRCDAHLGKLLNAIEARPDSDEWIVIVTTDHGHVDAGGHGGDSLVERQVWIACSEPSLEYELRDSATIASVAVRVTTGSRAAWPAGQSAMACSDSSPLTPSVPASRARRS